MGLWTLDSFYVLDITQGPLTISQTLKMFDNVLLEYGGLPKIFPLAVHLELLGTPS